MTDGAKVTKRVQSRGGNGRPRRARSASRVDQVEAALAGLAHDVRTPLNGILAFGELLAASQLPERERGWAVAIKGAAEHLAQLTSVVVDGAKANGRMLVLRALPFRPRQVAEEVAATLQARAETKGLAVIVTIAENLPAFVVGDSLRLRAALENLVDNAVKFTNEGQVTFAVRAQATRNRVRLVFEITDSGIGLSDAEIKRLFRPFAQANDTIAQRFGGAGLGLMFVKRIAQAMGGDLVVESAPGQGSCFRLVAMALGSTQGANDDADASEQAARAAGMNAYLAKPVSPAAIAALLDDLAGK